MRLSSSLFKDQSVIFFACFLFFFSNSALNAATLNGNYGFESANLKNISCSGNCPSISTSAASGKYSGNFTLTRSMSVPYRSEAVLNNNGNFDYGKEYWVGMNYRYEDWANDTSAESAPFQIHTRPGSWDPKCGGGSAYSQAPFMMISKNGEAQFITYKGKIMWRGPIQKNQWLNMTVHFRMSAGGDGFIEAWKNGVKLGRVDGKNVESHDKCGNAMRTPFLKLGVYKWDWKAGRPATQSSRRQMFIDDIKVVVGSNGASLVGAGSNASAASAPVVTSSAKVAIPDQKLVAHWSMETASGQTIPDISGNGSPGTLVNGAQVISGQGVKFDGINDYLNLGKLSVNSPEITISAWFLSQNLSNCSAQDCRIISKATGTADNNHDLMISTFRVGSKTRLRFRLKTNGRTSTLIADAGDIYKNEWTHVAAVYDGNTMSLYKDGVEVGSMFTQGNITSNSGSYVWIGDNPPNAGSRPWKGYIDDVRVYNYALTNKEIVVLAK